MNVKKNRLYLLDYSIWMLRIGKEWREGPSTLPQKVDMVDKDSSEALENPLR